MTRNNLWAAAVVLMIVGLWLYSRSGRPPAVEFDNLRYVQLLRTAVSARNAEWLAKVDSAVDQRLASGDMSSTEHAHFQSLIAMAREGAWNEADVACFQFEKAQLGRRRSLPASID